MPATDRAILAAEILKCLGRLNGARLLNQKTRAIDKGIPDLRGLSKQGTDAYRSMMEWTSQGGLMRAAYAARDAQKATKIADFRGL